MMAACSSRWESKYPRNQNRHRRNCHAISLIFLAGGIGISVVAGMQRAAQARQRRQAGELAEVVQLLNLATALVRDMHDRITRWSLGCQRLYGFTPEQALGRVSHDLLRTRFPEPLEAIRVTLLETGRWEGELAHVAADGREIVVASEWVLYRDAAGKQQAILETDTDITAQKRGEEAQMRLAKIVESSDDAILSKDLNRIIQSWNAGAQHIFGYSAEETIGHPTHHSSCAVLASAFGLRMAVTPL